MRTCKDLCQLYKIFSDKALQYDEGVYCATCVRYIKYPETDIIVVCMPNIDDPNYQFYDIGGNRQRVKVLVPIKKLRRSIRCKCCGTQCRANTHASNNSKLKKKIYNTFKALQESSLPRAKRAISNKTLLNKEKERIPEEQGVFDVFGELE